jgi:hypothetical protein
MLLAIYEISFLAFQKEQLLQRNWQMSAFEQPPNHPRWQPLAHLGRPALRQNMAERRWSGLGVCGAESGRLKFSNSNSISAHFPTPR